MKKTSSNFIAAFSDLNDQIVLAIKNKEFDRLLELDKARQQLLQDLILTSVDDVENELFDFIEICSFQNTNLIEEIQLELGNLIFRNNRFSKAITAYKN